MILGILTGALIFIIGALVGFYIRDQKPYTTMNIDQRPPSFLNTVTKKRTKLKPRANDDEHLFNQEKKERGQD